MDIFSKTLTSTLTSAWSQPTSDQRRAGLAFVSVQVICVSAAYNSATVTVKLQGTNSGQSAVDAKWEDIDSTAFTADGDGYLNANKISFIQPYNHYRLNVSHAGGTPSGGTVTAHLRGDVQ